MRRLSSCGIDRLWLVAEEDATTAYLPVCTCPKWERRFSREQVKALNVASDCCRT